MLTTNITTERNIIISKIMELFHFYFGTLWRLLSLLLLVFDTYYYFKLTDRST